MSSVDAFERLLDDTRVRLKTVPTLVDVVREINVTLFLQDSDYRDFETLNYDAVPTVRVLFCRELAGLSWNGLYTFLSTEHRAVRLGFDPANFRKYNTAPTRQTLTNIWDHDLSDDAKRVILSLSERLVDTAYENDDALDLRPPRHVDETASDLRERHVGKFSDEQIRTHVRHARNTIFGAFDSSRAANATYPDSRFNELQALMNSGLAMRPFYRSGKR